jgi:2Fe-2S ferredoxin
MGSIIFNTTEGSRIVASGSSGSLLDVARDYDIPGIEGDCGGVGSCGTCHVHVAQEWLAKIGAASDDEKDVVEQQPYAGPCSRLCCQIEVTAQLDGLEVTVPPREWA